MSQPTSFSSIAESSSRALYAQQLETMGIAEHQAHELGMSYSTPAETKLATGREAPALKLTIFDPAKTPVWSQYRFLTEVLIEGKVRRYGQPKGVSTRVDFSPNVDWSIKHPKVLIAEGIKKGRAAIVANPTLPVITVSSSTTWQRSGTKELHSDFSAIDLKDTHVNLALDFDLDTEGNHKPQIKAQETQFADALCKAGALVKVFRPLGLSDSVYKLDDLLQSGVSYERIEQSFIPYDYKPPYDKKSSAASVVLANAPENFKFVVDKLFPVDVGLLTATGGVGKTTFVLNAAIDFVLGKPIAGHEVLERGKVLIITGEDNHEIYGVRLRNIIEARNLTEAEMAIVGDSIFIEDFSSQNRPFVRDARGNLEFTGEPEKVIEEYQDESIKWVVIDPYISFAAPEHYVNDGAQKFIACCRKIVKAMQCFCLIVHHVSKAAAMSKDLDQHSSRGGSALPDGSRFVAGLASHDKHDKEMPASIDPHDFVNGFTVMQFKILKLSTAALPSNSFWYSRKGYTYEFMPVAVDVSAEELQRRQDETLKRQREEESKRLISVMVYLNSQTHEYNTQRSVADAHKEIIEIHRLSNSGEVLKKADIVLTLRKALDSGALRLVDPQVKKKGVREVLQWDKTKF